MRQKKTPLQKEWEILSKKETKFLNKRLEKKETLLNQKLSEKVPEKLQSTLDAAFAKAFHMVFEKGTGVIEKTYKREEIEKSYEVNKFSEEVHQNRKSLRAFSKKAQTSGMANLLFSGVSGVGLGLLGIGLPDIALFTATIFRSIYEIALHYGYSYDSEEEQYYILCLIQGAVAYGEDMFSINQEINDYIDMNCLPIGYERQTYIDKTASFLSKELLYMKFLQGIPIVGAVGGAYDAIYMKQIVEYANLKYKRRFLLEKGADTKLPV